MVWNSKKIQVTYYFGQEFWQFNLEGLLPGFAFNILSLFPYGEVILSIPTYKPVAYVVLASSYIAGVYTFITNLMYAKHKK